MVYSTVKFWYEFVVIKNVQIFTLPVIREYYKNNDCLSQNEQVFGQEVLFWVGSGDSGGQTEQELCFSDSK